MSIITSIFRRIKGRLNRIKVNKSQESKREYLRSLGAKVGDGTRFAAEAFLGDDPYLVEIGEDCLISSNVSFLAHDGGVKVLNSLGYFGDQQMDKMARIKIGNNCFLGSGCVILGGVVLGNNVIVGTRSIVTKSFPNNVVIAGMPARIICTIDDYLKKNLERGNFYPTCKMSPEEKKRYLMNNVSF